MYNLKMLKSEQEMFKQECNFSELELFIFENLSKGEKRKTTYELANKKYGISESTCYLATKELINKIKKCKNNKDYISYKIYIHRFPNGKNYVGVCQSCKDRWQEGKGYAHNNEMYKDIEKYGWNNIKHEILLELDDDVLAYKIEKILIKELNLIKNGYNKSDNN